MSSSTSPRSSLSSTITTIATYTLTIAIIILQPLLALVVTDVASAPPPTKEPQTKGASTTTQKRHTSLGSLSTGAQLSLPGSSPSRRCLSATYGSLLPLSVPLSRSPTLPPPPPAEAPSPLPPPVRVSAPVILPIRNLYNRGPQTPLPDRGEPISRKARRARKKREVAVSH